MSEFPFFPRSAKPVHGRGGCRATLLGAVSLALSLAAASCTFTSQERKKLPLGMEVKPLPYASSAAFRDTIGSLTYYQGAAPMLVRGYGLVVGLGKNGSTECPKPIFDRLVQDLYKHYRFSNEAVGSRSIPPEKLIEDPDTAVVLVQASIPPATVAGGRFDVFVQAVPGTRTKSLAGGRLYTSDLEMYREVSRGVTVAGRALAQASGPLFLNPFSGDEAATRTNPLEATILSGGTALDSRRVRLVLLEPSYHWAKQIQDRINDFTPGDERAADAVSPSIVQITIPRAYHQNPARYLSLIRHLYLSRDPQFAALRARELADEMTRPDAPYAEIAMCFEGLGAAALPVLHDLYGHPRPAVSFHAAVAGQRLGDHIAGDALVLHADKPDGEFRYRAIRALGDAPGMAGPGMCLRRLLDDEDPRVRVAAYESLLQRADPIVRTTRVGGDNFALDEVPTTRKGFLYARRSGDRRIAMFGDDLRLAPPVLYRSPEGAVTISAEPDATELSILRVVLSSGSTSPVLRSPLELSALIKLLGSPADVDLRGDITGLALDYGNVVRALYHLSADRAIDAAFLLEEPNASELFGPPRLESRPESEL